MDLFVVAVAYKGWSGRRAVLKKRHVEDAIRSQTKGVKCLVAPLPSALGQTTGKLPLPSIDNKERPKQRTRRTNDMHYKHRL
jgi:hypothetical protein